jgi:hypothetical protein
LACVVSSIGKSRYEARPKTEEKSKKRNRNLRTATNFSKDSGKNCGPILSVLLNVLRVLRANPYF